MRSSEPTTKKEAIETLINQIEEELEKRSK